MKVDHISCVVLEDWFVKSPPAEKLDQLKSWHKRYFALVRLAGNVNKLKIPVKRTLKKAGEQKEYFLVYWEQKTDREKGKKPMRAIAITSEDIVHIREHPVFPSEFPHVLAIHTKSRQYFLCAYSDIQQKLWYDVLTHIIQQRGEHNSTTNINIEKLSDDSIEVEEEEEDEVHDPIYATLWDVLDNGERLSSSSFEGLNMRQPSEPTYGSWKDFHLMGSKSRDSGISSMTVTSKSSDECAEQAPSFAKIHCLLTDTSDSSPCFNDEDLYEKMDAFKYTSKYIRGRGGGRRCSGPEISMRTNIAIEDAQTIRRYSSPFFKIDEESQNGYYDVPTSFRRGFNTQCRRGYKKINFFEITLEIPSDSVVKFTQNELRLKTAEREWILTKAADVADENAGVAETTVK